MSGTGLGYAYHPSHAVHHGEMSFAPEYPNRVPSIPTVTRMPSMPVPMQLSSHGHLGHGSMLPVSMPTMMHHVSMQNPQTRMTAVPQSMALPGMARVPSIPTTHRPIPSLSMVDPLMQSSIPYPTPVFTYGPYDPMMQQSAGYYLPMTTYSVGPPIGMLPQMRGTSVSGMGGDDGGSNENQASAKLSVSKDFSTDNASSPPSMYGSSAAYIGHPSGGYGMPMMGYAPMSYPMYAPYSDPGYGVSYSAMPQPQSHYHPYMPMPTSMQPTPSAAAPAAGGGHISHSHSQSQSQPHSQQTTQSNAANTHSHSHGHGPSNGKSSSNSSSQHFSVTGGRASHTNTNAVSHSHSSASHAASSRSIHAPPVTEPINIQQSTKHPPTAGSLNPSLSPTAFYSNLVSLKRNTPRLLSLPVEDVSDNPLFVSSRQYIQILKRREARRNDRRKRIKAKHKSRQLHAARRVRGQGGRFLTKAEKMKMLEEEEEERQRQERTSLSAGNGGDAGLGYGTSLVPPQYSAKPMPGGGQIGGSSVSPIIV